MIATISNHKEGHSVTIYLTRKLREVFKATSVVIERVDKTLKIRESVIMDNHTLTVREQGSITYTVEDTEELIGKYDCVIDGDYLILSKRSDSVVDKTTVNIEKMMKTNLTNFLDWLDKQNPLVRHDLTNEQVAELYLSQSSNPLIEKINQQLQSCVGFEQNGSTKFCKYCGLPEINHKK